MITKNNDLFPITDLVHFDEETAYMAQDDVMAYAECFDVRGAHYDLHTRGVHLSDRCVHRPVTD